MTPLVTVGLPFRNAETTLNAAIQSVVTQTLTDWELLLLDDGSTDGSRAVAETWLTDPRIRLCIGTKPRGLAARLNQLTQVATGRYLARMDADDLMCADRLMKQAVYLAQNPTVDVVGSWAHLTTATGRIRGVRKVPQRTTLLRLALFGYFIHPTVMGKASWFLANRYDEHIGPIEDYELWLRTARTARFAVLPEPLLVYRVSTGPEKRLVATRQIRQLLRRADLPLTGILRFGVVMYFRLKALYVKLSYSAVFKRVSSPNKPVQEPVPIRLVRMATVARTLRLTLRGQLRFLAEQGMHVTTVSADGPDVAGLIASESCCHFPVSLTRRINVLTDLRALWQTYRLLRQLRPDVVHSHTPKAGLIGMLAARLAGVPVRIHTITGLPLLEKQGILRWLLVQTERLMYAAATDVWSDSQAILPLIAGSVTRKATHFGVLNAGSVNGVDTRYFAPIPDVMRRAEQIRNELNLTGTFVWIFVGRIVPDKGIAELVRTIAELHQTNPAIRLLLVGEREEALTPLPDPAQRWLATHPALIEVGFQSDIRPYLAAADALVLPTYREGFPTVLLEAGCMNLPCVTTDINGCNEIVQHGRNGLLVPPRDQPALLAAMRRLMNEPMVRQQMAGQARARIVADFDQEVIWRAVAAGYQQAVHQSKR